ncbi:MAG: hypothetical protein ACFFD2_13450 [Promethearchaeota archaeon]
MVQTLEQVMGKTTIESSENPTEIRYALENLLYAPNDEIKEKIIDTFLDYLTARISEVNYNIKAYIAYYNSEPCGFVLSDLNPEYKSYGRKSGTFGWLFAKNKEVCKQLLKKCEIYAKKHRLRRIRGPINFPKNAMGYGLQVSGFEQPLLYGVAFNDPSSELGMWLPSLGYEMESEYTCLEVLEESWKKGNTLSRNLKLSCLTLEELEEKIDEIVELAGDSFSSLLPDTSGGGRENIEELLALAIDIPKRYFHHDFFYDPFQKYTHIPEFIEAWKETDLENMITVFPMILERNTNKLVGMLIGVLDYYQYWSRTYVSRVNVHTAMVRKGFSGMGVFSSLNNFGQATNRSMRGITYYEGTAIWSRNAKGMNNEQAINSIFPHCKPIRKHIIFEKQV